MDREAPIDAAEVESLRARLADAEETLRAIRAGEVDALLIDGSRGERIFTFEGAERPYRLLVEAMSEGAALILADGTVLFCNGRLAEMVAYPIDRVMGKPFQSFLPEASIATFEALVRRATETRATGEIQVRSGDRLMPVLVSIKSMDDANVPSLSLVATDLTEQKRSDEIIAAEKLARSILDQAADAIVVCDASGRVVRASEGAHRLCGENPLLKRFDDVFHLEGPAGLRESERVRGVEAVLHRKDGQRLDLLVSAARLHGADGSGIGRTYTLTDLTERRKVERERDRLFVREQDARREAENASRAKDEFVAVMSHELRTPLTAMLGWIHLMRAGRCGPRGPEHALEVIERNARSQAKLIEELLDLSRISTGKLAIETARIQLSAVLQNCMAAVGPQAEKKPVELRYECPVPPERTSVVGDAARLQQVFCNLLTNAIKFTATGGHVDVRVREEPGFVVVSVTDSGIGMTPDFLKHVFERFRQADGSKTRLHGGLGLGLSIARYLVEVHGGAIRATSPGPGKGSTFIVSLPTIALDGGDGEDGGDRADAAAPASLAPPRPARALGPHPLAGVSVLVVEDVPDTVTLLETFLTHHGASVAVATTVDEALAAFDRKRPTVLITDIAMPVRSGFDLIREIRAREATHLWPPTPMIALTAFARDEDRRDAVAASFAAHVTKPIDLHKLLDIVATLASRAHGAREGG